MIVDTSFLTPLIRFSHYATIAISDFAKRQSRHDTPRLIRRHYAITPRFTPADYAASQPLSCQP